MCCSRTKTRPIGRLYRIGFNSVGSFEGDSDLGDTTCLDTRHGADGDGSAGLRANGYGTACAGLSGLYAAAGWELRAKLLD